MQKFWVGVILVIAFVGGGVFGYQLIDRNVAAEESLGRALRTAPPQWAYLDTWKYEQRKPIYIVLNNYLMGEYRADQLPYNDPWCSWDEGGEYTHLRELTIVPSFKLYTMDKLVAERDVLALRRDEVHQPYSEEQWQALQAQGEATGDEETVCLKLPTNLRAKTVSKLGLPTRNAVVYFAKGEWERETDYILATNAKHDPRPKRVRQGGKLSEDYQGYFREVFKREGLGDVPLVMTDHYQYDADGDGKDEHVIILQNTTTPIASAERSKKNYGLYNYAFYADGERIQLMYNNKVLCSGKEAVEQSVDRTRVEYLTPLGVFDLNGDGKLEWCMDIGGWEWGSIVVYASFGESKYYPVLRSEYGM